MSIKLKDLKEKFAKHLYEISDEEFEQDLKDAGIEECLDKNNCPINNFGQLEGDVGACVDCSVENKDLFNVCWNETFRINDTSMIPEKDLSLSFIERTKELEKRL